MSAPDQKPIAFLFPAFPVLHQTFVLWEVLGLQRNGVQPLIYSMRPGTEKQQPEAADVAGSVRYLPGLFSVGVLTANLRLLLRAPRRYFSLYRNVVKAWRTGGDGFVQDGGRSGVPATAYSPASSRTEYHRRCRA